MQVSSRIASRYLFSKKENGFIQIISYLTMIAFAIGTGILVVVLSVFNGFEDFLLDRMENVFNADLVLESEKGKTFSLSTEQVEAIKNIDGVSYVSPILEETALLENDNARIVIQVKGVENDYFIDPAEDRVQSTYNESLNGKLMIIGEGLANQSSVDPDDPFSYVSLVFAVRDYKPLPGKKPNIFRSFEAMGTFRTKLSVHDGEYCFVNINELSKILNYKDRFTSVEVEYDQDSKEDKIIKSINQIVGDKNIKVLNAYQQDASTYKLLRMEKWMGFLITALIMMLVLFNLMACLWMIVLEKQSDIAIFKSMGLSDGKIFMVFLKLGMYYTFIGSGLGFVIGVVIVFLQDKFGLVRMSGDFLLQFYPVKFVISDLIIIIAMIIAFGIIASLPATSTAKQVKTDFRRT